MKKLALFATLVLALTMCASAQQLIDFTHLPDASAPQVIPANYGGMLWSNIMVVNSLEWSDAGPGFFTGNEVQTAFTGGYLCYPSYGGSVNDGHASNDICAGVITAGIGPNALATFKADRAVMSAGWTTGFVTATAYKNGVQVGQQRYNLTNNASVVVFPSAWGHITELKLTPNPLGSFVLFTFQVN